jgi:hypothetical protein
LTPLVALGPSLGEELQGLSTAYHCRQARGCFIFGSIASLVRMDPESNAANVQLQRVCSQLDESLEWGSDYNIVRRGAILMV